MNEETYHVNLSGLIWAQIQDLDHLDIKYLLEELADKANDKYKPHWTNVIVVTDGHAGCDC